MGMGSSPSGGSGQGDPLVGGAMTANMDRIGKLLKATAKELGDNGYCSYIAVEEVLEKHFGPLLRAGQYCRDGLEPGCEPDDTYAARYDAALATLECRDGK